MIYWRAIAAVSLTVLVGLPLLQPFASLADPTVWHWTTVDLLRVGWLSLNTLLLAGATCAVAIPAGTVVALVLFRGQVPGARWIHAVLVLLLFVPLPVTVSSWQGLLGARGVVPLAFWVSGEDRPWATGWLPAIWVHFLAAIPWVVCIVGLGLSWVESEVEETAALQIPPWRVALEVTLPRCRASILAATLFVGLQTASEISVTDMMLISTLAEEVYTQFTLGGTGLGRTLLLALPVLAAVTGALCVLIARLERALPPLPAALHTSRGLAARPARPWLLLLAVGITILIVPSVGLGWRLGEASQPGGWSASHAWNQLAGETRLLGGAVLCSVATATATGILVAALALISCWLAAGSSLFRIYLLVLLIVAWVMPGPVVGIGLKAMLLALPEGPWLGPLYYGPSPLPIVWAHLIRFMPAAAFFLWPVVRLVPHELLEAARLERAGPARQLLLIVWPLTRRAVALVGFAVTALALGEHEAAGRVETPRWESFAKLLFDRMHYGVDANVAAVALILLGAVSAVALLAFGGYLAFGFVAARRRRPT